MKEYNETAPPQLQRVLIIQKVSETGKTKLAILSATNWNLQDGRRRDSCKLICKHRLLRNSHRSPSSFYFISPTWLKSPAKKLPHAPLSPVTSQLPPHNSQPSSPTISSPNLAVKFAPRALNSPLNYNGTVRRSIPSFVYRHRPTMAASHMALSQRRTSTIGS